MKALRLGNRESLTRFGAADPGLCARSMQRAHLGEAMLDGGALTDLLEAARLSESPGTLGRGKAMRQRAYHVLVPGPRE